LLNRELITKSNWDIIHLDTVLGTAGTGFPLGTVSDPTDNLTDALAIAVANNLNSIHLHGPLTLDQSIAGYIVKAESSSKASIALNNQDVDGCIFQGIKLSGIQNGEIDAHYCAINGAQILDGEYEECSFIVNTPMVVKAGGSLFVNNCRSAIPGTDSPVFDFSNGGGILCSFRAWSGGIKIINSTDANNTTTIEFIAGKLNLPVSNTAGLLHARGVYHDNDLSADGFTVVSSGRTAAHDEIKSTVVDMNLI
jgi:hypothetical protein